MYVYMGMCIFGYVTLLEEKCLKILDFNKKKLFISTGINKI